MKLNFTDSTTTFMHKRVTTTCEPWTDERKKQVKKLWNEGQSATQIAMRIGGTSRNAVIGVVHRAGLLRSAGTPRKTAPNPLKRRNPLAAARAHVNARAAKIKAQPMVPLPAAPLPPPQVDDVARVALIDLEPHHCRWPSGEPVAGFCGERKVEGHSYCPGHLFRAYASPEPRRKPDYRPWPMTSKVLPAEREEVLETV